MPNRVAQE